MTAATEARAALERGRRLIIVTPPAVEHAGLVWELIASTEPATPTVIVCSDPVAATDWVAHAPPGLWVHAVTGLARAARLLKDRLPNVIAGAAKDLAELVARSALKLDAAGTVVVAWPESSAIGSAETLLDTLLAEARAARWIVLTWDPDALADFFERHAHRAPMVGAPPRNADGRAALPVGPARFAVTTRERRAATAHQVLDVLRATRAILWRRDAPLPSEPADAVVCLDLPSRAELASLLPLGPVVLLVTATQLPYARSIAAPLTPISLAGPVDRARDRAETLQSTVTQLLESRSVDGELTLLAPLFERYDPAEVAAALLALGSGPTESPTPASVTPKWQRLYVNVGKRDRAHAKDLVGALIRAAGVVKEQIGKVEVRDTFSLVELDPAVLDQAAARLTGATIRGRRLAPRRDRAG